MRAHRRHRRHVDGVALDSRERILLEHLQAALHRRQRRLAKLVQLQMLRAMAFMKMINMQETRLITRELSVTEL